MDVVVRLRSAVCLLGRFPALAGVDLVVTRGEALLVRGANGAGKTTLLRALAGLVPVVDGEASVLGCDLRRDRRGARRRVGVLGHGAALYDDLTVADNVRFWSRAGRAPAVDLAGADLASAMARFGLDGRLADVPAARLSAGQRRRTALAILVVRAPELWLLDEPHAGLDGAGRDVLDALVREVTAAGATVVLASHEADRADALATRSVTLAGGRIGGQDDAPPEDLALEGAAPGDAAPDDAGPHDAAPHDIAPVVGVGAPVRPEPVHVA